MYPHISSLHFSGWSSASGLLEPIQMNSESKRYGEWFSFQQRLLGVIVSGSICMSGRSYICLVSLFPSSPIIVPSWSPSPLLQTPSPWRWARGFFHGCGLLLFVGIFFVIKMFILHGNMEWKTLWTSPVHVIMILVNAVLLVREILFDTWYSSRGKKRGITMHLKLLLFIAKCYMFIRIIRTSVWAVGFYERWK